MKHAVGLNLDFDGASSLAALLGAALPAVGASFLRHV